ncbi:hypothetical protein Tco_0661398 [Tanacetum coccineum]
MDLLSFIRTADPTKVRIGERQRGEDEPKLLDTTVGRTVPLLPVAPARAESELDASVDRLFDEGGSGTQAEQGDSAGGGGDEQDIPRRPKKRKTTVFDAGKSSHPPKKLREDHETLSGASVGGDPISTLPFVTSSVSAKPEREEADHTDSLAGANLRANIAEAEADSFIRPSVLLMTMTTAVTSIVDPTTTAKEKLVESSVFGDGSSSGADHTVGGFSGLTGSDFIVGGIHTIVSPNTDIQKVYVPQWSVTNGSRLDDDRTCREMVDEFAPPSAEVRMRAEFNIKEKRRLSVVVEEKNLLLKTKDEEVANLKAQLLVKELEATEAICFRAEVHNLVDRNIVLEREKGELDIKVADLAATVKVREQEVADLDAMVTSVKFHNDNLTDQLEASSAVLQDKVTAYENFMEERFYPHLLTTIFGRRWILTHGLELAIAKCLNSTEYLSSLGAAIGKAVEKGMQEGLSVRITHGVAGRVLTDVAAYNPSTEADYLSALHRLQSVKFSLISELKSNKDASIDTIMNLLYLEDSLAERLNLAKSQPHVDQLMIKENIANDRSALRDVFVLLAEPLSIAALEGTAGTYGTAPDTTTALSMTFASTSTIPPISTDDYEIVHTDDQEGTDADGQTSTCADANLFPSIDDAELNVSE